MITERFKNAVIACVADGILSSEEKEMLEKLAKEENINDLDAQVYITAQLKRIRNEKENEENRKKRIPNPDKTNTSDIIKEIGGAVVAIGGFVLTVLTATGKIGPKKK